MKKLLILIAVLTGSIFMTANSESKGNQSMFYSNLQQYIEKAIGEFDQIDKDRKAQLQEMADFIQTQLKEGKTAQLTYICTHNSRRSHLSQIWAQTAAAYFGLENVQAYSGGTEATAFNPRAVAALVRAGFVVEKTTEATNPIYHIKFSETCKPITCFSKVYNDAPNPTKEFCAVMTCSQADASCPLVSGALARISIPYIDPKVSDDTPQEADTYDERTKQICRELFYVFSLVK